ncbi:YkvI family membrane protein [Risungbinella massiliensis]|uniref:YkvI family membrane protein n=1 Tax=Risungbinella massiliensis TaxID=1329796 RepID=UPI0005CBC2DA|nr:hypothetical protein [Risungbinella massiliensis]
MKKVWLACRIGFTYAGTIVGAGFASGQEILQFFTLFGSFGFWGILLSTFLFAWLGQRILQFGARTKASTYEELNRYLFGERIGRLINLAVGIMLFGATTAMMSGVGSLSSEHLGISFHLGVLLTTFLAFFVLIRGIEGIISVNSVVVPLMFGFILMIGFYAWLNGEWTVIMQKDVIQTGGSWITSAILYVAFNLVMAQAVLVPLGSAVEKEEICKLGAWIGAGLLGIMLLAGDYALQVNLEQVINKEIPMAYLVYPFGFWIKAAFLLLMWSEIFTTLISNVFGLTAKLQEISTIRPVHWMMIIFILGYAFSLIGFPTLVKVLYPAFGYCGLLLVGMMLFRNIPTK